jgi:hypothetical protein
MTICLYCDSPANSVEHPLPAAFGEFNNAPVLEDRICRQCNNARLGLLDEQFARCGPEAVMRRFHGIKGRDSHEAVNPHYRGSAGGRRLRMTGYDSAMGMEVELEIVRKGEVRQSCQMVVIDTEGRAHHLPITRDLRDPQKLRASFHKLGVTQPADVRLIFDPSERQWLEPLVKAAWPTASLSEKGSGAANYQGAVVELQVNDRYFRGIAKIGFHYFLTQFPQYSGSENCFAAVRSFIIDDAGGLDRVNEFVGVRSKPLLTPMMDGRRPDGWIAHVLSAEIRDDEILAHVEFFVSLDYRSVVYTVKLGKNDPGRLTAAIGHIYRYFGDGPVGKFAGEARPLLVTRRAESEPLKPAIAR